MMVTSPIEVRQGVSMEPRSSGNPLEVHPGTRVASSSVHAFSTSHTHTSHTRARSVSPSLLRPSAVQRFGDTAVDSVAPRSDPTPVHPYLPPAVSQLQTPPPAALPEKEATPDRVKVVLRQILPAVALTLLATNAGSVVFTQTVDLPFSLAGSGAMVCLAIAVLTVYIYRVFGEFTVAPPAAVVLPASVEAMPLYHMQKLMGTQNTDTQRWASGVVHRTPHLSNTSVMCNTTPFVEEDCSADECASTSTCASETERGAVAPSLVLVSALRIKSTRFLKGKTPQVRRGTVLVTGVPAAASFAVMQPEVFSAHLAHVMARIADMVGRSQGVLHAAIGETMVASFGTTRYKYSHMQAAATTALHLKNLFVEPTPPPLPASLTMEHTDNTISTVSQEAREVGSLHLTVALASGDMLCGVMGCEVWKNHTVIGMPLNRAMALHQLCGGIGARVLVDSEIRRGCIDCMVTRFADVIGWKGTAGMERIYELLSSRAANSKEWMYYDETQYDVAVQHLLKGEYERAETTFRLHNETTHETDANALRLESLARLRAAPPFSLL